jgi:hypothetical protein
MEDGKYGMDEIRLKQSQLITGYLVDGSLWFYAPNKGAPVVFAVLFAISFGCHSYQCV